MTDGDAPRDDPYRAVREAYERALEGWSKTVEQMVASEGFAEASGDLLRRYVDMEAAMREASTAGAGRMHLPTLDDLARLARLVVNVERKVDEVSDEVHAMTARLDAIQATLDLLAPPAAPPGGAAG